LATSGTEGEANLDPVADVLDKQLITEVSYTCEKACLT
tara:strand:+ start:206 stop:319 length:114 start_codon:yes stop_codon:yes gene_type:complete